MPNSCSGTADSPDWQDGNWYDRIKQFRKFNYILKHGACTERQKIGIAFFVFPFFVIVWHTSCQIGATYINKKQNNFVGRHLRLWAIIAAIILAMSG